MCDFTKGQLERLIAIAAREQRYRCIDALPEEWHGAHALRIQNTSPPDPQKVLDEWKEGAKPMRKPENKRPSYRFKVDDIVDYVKKDYKTKELMVKRSGGKVTQVRQLDNGKFLYFSITVEFPGQDPMNYDDESLRLHKD